MFKLNLKATNHFLGFSKSEFVAFSTSFLVSPVAVHAFITISQFICWTRIAKLLLYLNIVLGH